MSENNKVETRLGLALSGGGLRASFFHIGVLAQMAKLGLLRQVEVISTVSGGSIIGALYYLHVKKLLENKPDSEITDQDYIKMIQDIEKQFLQAVQKNIRMRVFINPLKNIRMIFPNYSRSDRIGELYDRYFYRPVFHPNRNTLIKMNELKIQPKGDKDDFHPRKDNRERNAKVPILKLNATTLNTGHSWRFEVLRMGEPEIPESKKIAKEIDKNLRLLAPYPYEEIVEDQKDFELGLAVAASACVPALFHPLAISGLFLKFIRDDNPEDIRVQLVDGGVRDNQGIEGLTDEKCTLFIISDASGQMQDEADPSTNILSVISRTNSILMDHVREEQIAGLYQNYDPEKAPIAFMHLRKGLSAPVISCQLSQNKQPKEIEKEGDPGEASESFGVSQRIQDLLSKVRTDLDSFTEVEAYSLMMDGFQMSARPIHRLIKNHNLESNPTSDNYKWKFVDIKAWLSNSAEKSRYVCHLETASHRVFKAFRLSRKVTIATAIIVLGILFGLWALFKNEMVTFLSQSISVWQLVLFVLLLLIGFIPKLSRSVKLFRFLRSPSEYVVRFAFRGVLPVIGSIFVWIHLQIFDRLFIQLGKLKQLGDPPAESN
ncbi:MAG: patatin-like phospholipase family protein [Promethearchaeota archaeon]|jgi:NTE family protein